MLKPRSGWQKPKVIICMRRKKKSLGVEFGVRKVLMRVSLVRPGKALS